MVPDLYPIRCTFVVCHLLVDDTGCVLIDTGLIGEPWRIERVMRKLGWNPSDLRSILLTHGHLDHAGNLFKLKRWSGATVYGHRAEQIHIDGRYPYRGITRACGWLEAFGRGALRYTPASIEHTIDDGDKLPFWGGLEVIHLPGHSKGHCGFYSAKHDLLFAGDLFISHFFGTYHPPAIFNSDPHLLPESYRRVVSLNPQGILTNHYDCCKPERIKTRFDRFYQKHYGRTVPSDIDIS